MPSLARKKKILEGVEPPAARDLAQVDATTHGDVGRCQVTHFHFDLLPRIFFHRYRDHRDLHSFPTRRSSDLAAAIADVALPASRGRIQVPLAVRVLEPHAF